MTPTRREMIEMAARAAALPGAAAFFAAWLHAQDHTHSDAPPEPPILRDYKPQFFDPADFEALQSFTEILIPTDDTPGAREARCAHFIDFLLHASDAVPATQQRWRDAMAALREAGFHSADAKRRAAIVAEASLPERDASAKHPCYAAYRLIKQQNAFAFYTSRAGMIEAIEYKGNSYNPAFPACNHPEHHTI